MERTVGDVVALFTAPPAPVSVMDEDLLHMAASAIEDLLSNEDRSGAGYGLTCLPSYAATPCFRVQMATLR